MHLFHFHSALEIYLTFTKHLPCIRDCSKHLNNVNSMSRNTLRDRFYHCIEQNEGKTGVQKSEVPSCYSHSRWWKSWGLKPRGPSAEAVFSATMSNCPRRVRRRHTVGVKMGRNHRFGGEKW